MNTQLEILLIKKINEKYYLQNTKTSSNNGQKKKKKSYNNLSMNSILEMAYSTIGMIGTLNLHKDSFHSSCSNQYSQHPAYSVGDS